MQRLARPQAAAGERTQGSRIAFWMLWQQGEIRQQTSIAVHAGKLLANGAGQPQRVGSRFSKHTLGRR